MIDNDADLKDGQKEPTPYRGPKASNTLETLRPKEVNVPQYADFVGLTQKADSLPLQGRGLPPVDYEEKALDYDIGPRELYKSSEPFIPGNVLPVDWPTALETMKPETIWGSDSGKPVLQRIERLEEQVDGLLDRIAQHNIKSSHKI